MYYYVYILPSYIIATGTAGLFEHRHYRPLNLIHPSAAVSELYNNLADIRVLHKSTNLTPAVQFHQHLYRRCYRANIPLSPLSSYIGKTSVSYRKIEVKGAKFFAVGTVALSDAAQRIDRLTALSLYTSLLRGLSSHSSAMVPISVNDFIVEAKADNTRLRY